MKLFRTWPRTRLAALVGLLGVCLLVSGLVGPPARAAYAVAPGAAPRPAAGGPAGRPLGELLNADGTVNLGTGYSGTLDAAGWQLAGGLAGSPRFVPTAAGDENWDDRFDVLGLNDQVT